MEDDWIPLTTRYPGRYSASLLAAIDKGLGLRPKDRPPSVAAWRELLNETAPPLPPEERVWMQEEPRGLRLRCHPSQNAFRLVAWWPPSLE